MIMLLVAICAIGWRSDDILQAIGAANAAQDPATISIDMLTLQQPPAGQRPMSAAEFSELSKTDPDAYRKFVRSYEVRERSEVDKLLNFLARGAYE